LVINSRHTVKIVIVVYLFITIGVTCILFSLRTHVSLTYVTIFERKILRKMFGPAKEVNGLWRIKSNEELDDQIQQK
jgi:hypothetical protein